MINTGNMFSNDFQALEQLASAASKAFGQPFQETVYKPSTSAKVDFPIDEYLDKDGNYTVQMAVVGLDSEDVKVTVKTEGGVKTLNIKVNGPELTDEQKKEIETRDWWNKKIKRANKLEFTRNLPATLDVTKTSKKVEKGLLTVTIPIREEEKPVEIEIK